MLKLTLQDAIIWCQMHHATVQFTDKHTSVEAPGFDKIIDSSLIDAVRYAIETEESLKQPAEQTIPNPSWLPSAAELDAAECELAVREMEEGQAAYAEMVEDESRAIMAQPINGAYFL